MTIHTELPPPEKTGEHRLARQLEGLNIQGMHLWFNIASVPGVGEIDLVIWRAQGGLFVCEVKSLPINAIKEYSRSTWKHRTARAVSRAPHIATDEKRHKLRNQLAPKFQRRYPWDVSVVVWTDFSRQEWLDAFDDEVAELAHSMIFAEDLVDMESFDRALVSIAENPATGVGPKEGLRPNDDTHVVRFSRVLLGETQTPRTRRSDLEKLRLLEFQVASQVLKDAPVDLQSSVLYRGGPGTGKTFRLLQLGINYVLAEREVLYVCFNKTLAADIGRMFKLVPQVRRAENFPSIFDAADLLRFMSQMMDVDLGDNGVLELGDKFEILRSKLEESARDVATYDLVLIDEVQDMNDWMLDLCQLLCAPGGSIAIAEGVGQQLYGDAGDILGHFRTKARTVNLVRNFRNTEPTYKVAAHMRHWAKSLGEPQAVGDTQVRFDRESGPPPRIELLLDLPQHHMELSPTIAYGLTMEEEYGRLLVSEIASLARQHDSTDLFVLVPTDESLERAWAHEALTALNIPFVDYTRTKNNTPRWSAFIDDRRRAPEGEMLRLCTYRSSRGLEGTRVLIFGLERALEIARSQGSSADSLLHIVLSRALIDTVIAIPQSASSRERSQLELVLKRR